MPAIQQQLRLTDTADVIRSVRWRDSAGAAYSLTSGRLVIRATETEPDATAPLLDVAAQIDDDLATVVLFKSAIKAANFEALLNPAVWEFVIVRAVDGRTLSALGGRVVWTPGVAR